MCVTRAIRAVRVAMARTVVAVAAVVKTKAKIRARKNRRLPLLANVRPASRVISKSLVTAHLRVNNALLLLAQLPRRVLLQIVPRTSFWMTKWITSATALITSARTRTRTRVVVVAQALHPLVPAQRQVQRLPHAALAQAVRAAAAQQLARRQPSATVHATVLRAMVRLVVTRTRATVVRHAMTQPARNRQFAVLVTARASRNRKSCTKSRKAIASRPLNNSTNYQAAHAVKNQHC